jgi:prepilin-type N-terminal cleavage/methylation domain-containing protein
MNRFVRAKLGFSLVELMIVVAIIGVLATIGVPTFRTMVQKAKKSEAKVALGALYTSEVAFFSEYGTYGNALDKIGYELDGNAATRTYRSGFTTGTACATTTTILPASTAGLGSSLNIAFPSYYVGSVFQVANKDSATSYSNCPTADVTAGGASFTAVSAGIISPKTATAPDIWTINEQRTLANTRDGVL